MKIGVLGTGDVGKSMANGFVALGHDVKMGARESGNPKAAEWVKSREGAAGGGKASAGTFAEAAAFGEIVVLATLGVATVAAIEAAGKASFDGKLVIDTTNPLAPGKPELAVGFSDSGGEQIQRAIPKAHIVKAFNTVGNALFFRPSLPGGPPDMFICGDDDGAKERAAAIVKDFGWGVIDLGGIAASRCMEPMCIAWVLHGLRSKGWTHAFKMLHA